MGQEFDETKAASVFLCGRAIKGEGNRVDRQLEWNQDNAAAPDSDPRSCTLYVTRIPCGLVDIKLSVLANQNQNICHV